MAHTIQQVDDDIRMVSGLIREFLRENNLPKLTFTMRPDGDVDITGSSEEWIALSGLIKDHRKRTGG